MTFSDVLSEVCRVVGFFLWLVPVACIWVVYACTALQNWCDFSRLVTGLVDISCLSLTDDATP
jgi:hypothetical protein